MQIESLLGNLRKVIRYCRIYGISRTYVKVVARSGRYVRLFSVPSGARKNVCVVGCGQFAFSTIGFYLRKQFGRCFATCFDVSSVAAARFARYYGVADVATSADEAIDSPFVDTVFIASNHASHAEYALTAIREEKTVYIEKPIAVNWEDLAKLLKESRLRPGSVYAGYNRPFSSAIRQLRSNCANFDQPLTLSCFISGHDLPADHWYRDPVEGTRICGNAGHWLDLLVHILNWGIVPDQWLIRLAWGDPQMADENLAINLSSRRGDLANIVISARTEPFEGINETINFQWGDCIAKIDDFQRMTVWNGERRSSRRYWPKDVGHKLAIRQPWTEEKREWRELEMSAMLVLTIADMVKAKKASAEFSFSDCYRRIGLE